MTVVFDTNVLVAAIVAKGLCHEALDRALAGRLLASSIPLLDELEETLHRKLDAGPATKDFLSRLRRHSCTALSTVRSTSSSVMPRRRCSP